jgi:hypothetical protein
MWNHKNDFINLQQQGQRHKEQEQDGRGANEESSYTSFSDLTDSTKNGYQSLTTNWMSLIPWQMQMSSGLPTHGSIE